MDLNNYGYRHMISNFRSNELQTLLKSSGFSTAGHKAELKDRVLTLLRNESIQGFNHQKYLAKIVEIYLTMETQIFKKMNTNRKKYQPHPYSRNITVDNEQLSMEAGDQMDYDLNTAHSSNKIIATQSVTNITFKKLHFYEIVEDICKIGILNGEEVCTLENNDEGMKEMVYKMPLSLQQANYIKMGQDFSNTKNVYYYQAQIRICLLVPGSTEISDLLPIGLQIQINSELCPLPPFPSNSRLGSKDRRIPEPINCSNFLKLDLTIQNTIKFSWVPDGNEYAWGMFLVKKISSDFLLQQLLTKEARSSDETKNDIIKRLADADPDLATTSYHFSLLCPLEKVRMKIPAKSISCDHLQCFDARAFILMNERKPTWLCPICNNVCNYDDIQIESYFLDIVTSSSLPNICEEIEILADGTWRVYVEPDNNQNIDCVIDDENNSVDFVNLDSDDENDSVPNIFIKEPKIEPNPKSAKESSGNSLVIDLTLDDDNGNYLPTENNTQKNYAQSADIIQPASTSIDIKPVHLQPQQVVISSEHGRK